MTYQKQIEKEANIELSRLLYALGYHKKSELFEEYKENILLINKYVRKRLSNSSNFRSPFYLIPVLLYFYLKTQHVFISQEWFLKTCRLSLKTFWYIQLKIYIYFILGKHQSEFLN